MSRILLKGSVSGVCSVCGKDTICDGFGTGYGIDKNNNIVCYECCGKHDKQKLLNLKKGERFSLYLTKGEIINWCGTLRLMPSRISKGYHNIAGSRTDVWFQIDTKKFHGTQYGDNNEVLHIQTVK